MLSSGASTDALITYERVCAEMDEELVVVAGRLADALVEVSSEFGSCSSLGHDLGRFARDALAHDRRAGRTGRRFCDADASYAFDRWTGAEVASWARTLPPSSAGLLDRLHVEGLGELAEAVAAGPPPERRGFFEGVWEGLTVGSFEQEPFADGSGQIGKATGQLLSGFAVYGDVRDSVAEFSRGNWAGGLWDAAGAFPGLGDAAKLLGFALEGGTIIRHASRATDAADAAHGATRSADGVADAANHIVPGGGLLAHEALDGHTLALHVGRTEDWLRARARTENRASSSFYDAATAERAVAAALTAHHDDVAAVVSGARKEAVLVIDLAGPVGLRVAGGDAPVEHVSTIRVIVRPADTPLGYRIHTAYPIANR